MLFGDTFALPVKPSEYYATVRTTDTSFVERIVSTTLNHGKSLILFEFPCRELDNLTANLKKLVVPGVPRAFSLKICSYLNESVRFTNSLAFTYFAMLRKSIHSCQKS